MVCSLRGRGTWATARVVREPQLLYFLLWISALLWMRSVAAFGRRVGRRTFASSRLLRNEKRVLVSEQGPLFLNEAAIRNHRVPIDEAEAEGGANQGPTPCVIYSVQPFLEKLSREYHSLVRRYELLMAALGSCTSITCRMYAKHKKLPLEKINVEVFHRKLLPTDPEAQGGRTEIFTREIEFVGKDLTDEHIKRLMVIADKCPVHHALTSNHSLVVSKTK